MAATNLAEVLSAPGRLCVTPTDLSTAFPHGGTALGSVRKVLTRRVVTKVPIVDEAFGKEIRDWVWGGENYFLAFILRQWDATAVATFFPNTATGATSNRVGIESPGSVRPGALASTFSVKLLFSPLDPERVPAVILYAAAPFTEETTELNHAAQQRQEIACVCHAMRDTSTPTRIWQAKFLKDITL